ncbi:MAG: cation transporter [Planctomycetota bacterium]
MSSTLRKTSFLVSVALLSLLFASPSAQAEEKKKVTNTTVTVGEMCMGCVKQITAHFEKEKRVSKITCDIKKRSVTIVPAKDVRLTAKTIWEIMESIGKKPQKLVGPEGTFTSKPKKG